MKAARLHKIGDFRLDEITKPTPTGEQILVKIGACGICGSDLPRVYELGTSKQKYPLVLGHEFGGEIVELGSKVDSKYLGKRGAIFPCIPCMECEMCLSGNYALCLDYDYLGSRSDGGFAEYCLVPSVWHFVEANDKVSDNSLAMVEPCTVAQHSIRKAELVAGYSCLIFGAGPIGIMAARWAHIFGASRVMLVDISNEKINFAKNKGHHCINAKDPDFKEQLDKFNKGKKFDVVIEGTGTGIAIDQSVDAVKTFGTIVLMGNPHKETTIKLHTHSNILRKELVIKGMWNSHYNDVPINEWKYTIEMLESEKLVIDDLVTHESTSEEFIKLFDDIYNGKLSVCKAVYKVKENA